MAQSEEAFEEYGIHLSKWDDLNDIDVIIVAVAHRSYADMEIQKLLKPLRSQREGVVIDVKCLLDQTKLPKTLKYWRL
jgi:UDP-N-acetyl-D-galactosamine dehydrogenase